VLGLGAGPITAFASLSAPLLLEAVAGLALWRTLGSAPALLRTLGSALALLRTLGSALADASPWRTGARRP